jgi:deazaflavin-dependent oxidoreductase (nitroreductase family)
MEPKITQAAGLPPIMRLVNQAVVLAYRLGLGRWFTSFPKVTPQIMVLTHTGRRSGLPYKTPVAYAIVDGDVYCAVSTGERTNWLLNIKANPQVEVWLREGWWAGEAEEVTDPAQRVPLMRQVMAASGIPARAAGIHPVTASDEELDSQTADFRLFRIQRKEARTGPGGPGELAWVWPLALLFLVFRVSRGRRRKR